MADDLTGDVSGLELTRMDTPPNPIFPDLPDVDWPEERESFEKELERLCNRHSLENESNTPDFILAAYIRTCLHAWREATAARDSWYGISPQPGWQKTGMLPGLLEPDQVPSLPRPEESS